MTQDIEQLERIASQIRRDVLRMIHAPKSGHTGGSLGCADLMTAIYFSVMEHNPKEFTIDGVDEDLFFLSNGHIAPVWYSTLARSGYFPIEELGTLRKLGTRLQGHPTTHDELPGIRISSGSLGQGISVAAGAALAKKLNGDEKTVFVLTGDGESDEGQIWEAAMFAAGRKIDNLIAITDYNGLQIDGPTDEVMPLGNLRAKWEAFGWTVLETNGNNMQELVETFNRAKSELGKGKPVFILMHTIMGKGVDFMENKHHWHGTAPNDEQLQLALNQLEETLGDY
jgi:transketolase